MEDQLLVTPYCSTSVKALKTDSGKHQYCSNYQKEELVQLVTADPDLLSGKITASFTFKESQRRWSQIATTLNAIPGGHKDWKQWRKTWQDMKSHTKAKKASVVRHTIGTGGGGGSSSYTLTPIEEQVLSVISPTAITGDIGVSETLCEFVFEDDADNTEGLTTDTNALEVTLPENVTQKQQKKTTPKRTVTTNRLAQSAAATASLSELSRERLAFEKEKFAFEKSYKERKLEILQMQAKALEDIAVAVKAQYSA